MYVPETKNGRTDRRLFVLLGKKKTNYYSSSLIPPSDGPACKASKQCNFSHKINHRMLNSKACLESYFLSKLQLYINYTLVLPMPKLYLLKLYINI